MTDLDDAARDLCRKGSRFQIEQRPGEIRLTDQAPGPAAEPELDPEPEWGTAELCVSCGRVANERNSGVVKDLKGRPIGRRHREIKCM